MDGWHIECCHPPPGVGDRVSWPLQWIDEPSGPGASRFAWQAQPLPVTAGNEPGDLVLRHGPLTAYWRGSATPPVHGLLAADVHGGIPEAVVPVEGTVLAVAVVDQAYRLSGPRTYVPIPGDFRLRPVVRSPKWFDSGDGERFAHPMRQDSGVLVRLSVGPG